MKRNQINDCVLWWNNKQWWPAVVVDYVLLIKESIDTKKRTSLHQDSNPRPDLPDHDSTFYVTGTVTSVLTTPPFVAPLYYHCLEVWGDLKCTGSQIDWCTGNCKAIIRVIIYLPRSTRPGFQLMTSRLWTVYLMSLIRCRTPSFYKLLIHWNYLIGLLEKAGSLPVALSFGFTTYKWTTPFHFITFTTLLDISIQLNLPHKCAIIVWPGFQIYLSPTPTDSYTVFNQLLGLPFLAMGHTSPWTISSPLRQHNGTHAIQVCRQLEPLSQFSARYPSLLGM